MTFTWIFQGSTTDIYVNEFDKCPDLGKVSKKGKVNGVLHEGVGGWIGKCWFFFQL